MTATAQMQGVLDEMVAGFSARKTGAAAGAGLTPVGTEKHGPLDGHHDVAFPYDDPQTVVLAIRQGLKLVADMSTELDHVRKGLVMLGALYGVVEGNEEAPVPVTAAQKREAAIFAGTDPTPDSEAEFEEMLAVKSAAAQAATFKPFEEPKPEAVAGDAGWQCPDHGVDNLVTLTSRAGSKYRACRVGKCAKYEKKGTVTS